MDSSEAVMVTLTSVTPLLRSQSTKSAAMKKAAAGVRVMASPGLTGEGVRERYQAQCEDQNRMRQQQQVGEQNRRALVEGYILHCGYCSMADALSLCAGAAAI